MPKRIPHIIALAGKRGTGKTTVGKKFIASSSMEKVLIVDTFLHPSYSDVEEIKKDKLLNWGHNGSGIRRIVVAGETMEEDLAHIQNSMYNALVVYEDATKYLGKTLTKSMKGMLADSKQKNIDILFMFHSLRLITVDLFDWLNAIVLFKTNDKIEQQKNRLAYYDDIEPKYREIRSSSDNYIYKTIELN